MTKHNFHQEFISIAKDLYRHGLPDPVEAAAEHPLMRKATEFALLGGFGDQQGQDTYQEQLVAVGWEFCLGPDELCWAMEKAQKRLVNDQA